MIELRPAIIALSVLAFACGKDEGTSEKKADSGAEEKGGADAEKADAAPAGPDFSAWDQAGKQKAWEGSWLVKENGKIQAWTVAGTKVTSWDGEGEGSFELEMEAPCRARFKNDKGMSFPRNFSVVNGAVRYRGMGAGYRNGDDAIYCDGSGAIYVLAGGKCTIWEDDFGKWTSKDGECGIKQNAEGADVFHHADPNGGEFPLEGDAILSKTSFETEKVEGDHAAAKAARDAKAAE